MKEQSTMRIYLICTKPGLQFKTETCLRSYRLRNPGDSMTIGVHCEFQLSAHAKGLWDSPDGGKTMGLGLQLAKGAGSVQ